MKGLRIVLIGKNPIQDITQECIHRDVANGIEPIKEAKSLPSLVGFDERGPPCCEIVERDGSWF